MARAQLRVQGLYELYSSLEAVNVESFLTDGSLLGAVRDGLLIPWDWDHELTVKRTTFCEKFDVIVKSAKAAGFKVLFFDSDYDNLKINFTKYDEKYCLLVLHERGDYYRRRHFKYPKAFFDGFSFIKLSGHVFRAPSDAQAYLAHQYGSDWSVPNESDNQKEYLASGLFVSNFGLRRANLSKWFRQRVYIFWYRLLARLADNVAREPMFLEMISQSMAVSKVTFFEIGSSDGAEASYVLKNHVENLQQLILCEPRQEACETYAHVVRGFSLVNIFQCAIAKSEGEGDFYLSKQHPNLSSRNKNRMTGTKVSVSYRSPERVLSEVPSIKNLVLKMDIEGAEVEVLESFLPLCDQFETVSFLIELHQFEYSPENDMRAVLESYFQRGFRVSLVETAGLKMPKSFSNLDFRVAKSLGGRSLLEVNDQSEMIDYLCDNYGEPCMNHTKFTPKLLRSFLLTNNTVLRK